MVIVTNIISAVLTMLMVMIFRTDMIMMMEMLLMMVMVTFDNLCRSDKTSRKLTLVLGDLPSKVKSFF